MSRFDRYAFADYSGSSDLRSQRKHIVLAVQSAQGLETSHHTREELFERMKALLAEAAQAGERVLFGFDHSYSFPVGFYETVTGEPWTHWEQLLHLLQKGTAHLPPVNGQPRLWAEHANQLLANKLGLATGGPFWGSHFKPQIKDPKFPHADTPLPERRLTEQRDKRMKPIYKLGGAGAVGLQALYGIEYIAKLREHCRTQDIPLFCWPFDGWQVPDEGHVLVEMYPTMVNSGTRTDEDDAKSCVLWLAEQDRENKLGAWLAPPLTEEEQARARVEGWVLGVM